jgi:hypothetical protein
LTSTIRKNGTHRGSQDSGSATGTIDHDRAHDQLADAAPQQSFRQHEIKRLRADPDPKRFLIKFISKNGFGSQQNREQHDEIDARPNGTAHQEFAGHRALGEFLDRRHWRSTGVDVGRRDRG